MKKTSKIVVIVLVMAVVLSSLLANHSSKIEGVETAGTSESSGENTVLCKIAESLNHIKEDGQLEMFGMGDVDFSNLKSGVAIPAYAYTENGYERLESVYPIVDEENIIAFARKRDGTDEGISYEITTALTKQINEHFKRSMKYALVYDRYNAYLYDGNELIWLYTYSFEMEERNIIDLENLTGIDTLETVCLNEITDVFESVDIDIQNEVMSAAAVEVDIPNIAYVSQLIGLNGDELSPSLICWAATAACMANAYIGTDYTAAEVAELYRKTYHPSWSTYNEGLPNNESGKLLTLVGMPNYYNKKDPIESTLYANVERGYPIYGIFATSIDAEMTHNVTIYGVNKRSHYIYIMDPEFGGTLAFRVLNNKVNQYQYTSSSESGANLTLYEAWMRYTYK